MSALTSLLVRDDAVSVRQIEDALQRQIMDGGELDTALLELGALPENVLAAYRAASEHGLPASREEVMSASAATRVLLPADKAVALRVTPLTHDATSLTVAGCRPLSAAELKELADCTGLRIAQRITSELRVAAALERFYGVPMSERLSALLARVDALPPGELRGVEQLPADPLADRHEHAAPLPDFDESEDFEAALSAAFERASGAPGSGPPATRKDSDEPGATRPLGGKQRRRRSSPGLVQPGDAARRTAEGAERDRLAEAQLVSANARASAAANARRPAVRLPQGPLTALTVEEALDAAEERDAVVELCFRFARQYFDTTLLLSIKDERAVGSMAHNASALVDVRDVSVPILRGGAIDDMMRSLLPRVVDLSRKEEDRVLALSIKRLAAQPAALMPICIKRRVVSVLYGDRSGEVLYIDELAELLGLLPHVSRAFERIIRTRKALGLSNTGTPTGFRDLSHAPTQRSIRVPHLPQLGAAPDSGALEDRAQRALETLGVGRPAPLPPAPRLPSAPPPPPTAEELDQDIYATARIPIQPLSLEQFDSPPRYLSKPPPGAGRYQSLRPSQAAAVDDLTPRTGSAHGLPRAEVPEPSAAEREDQTQRLRNRKSGRPRYGRSQPPCPRQSAPPPAIPPGPLRASFHTSKPAPGAGAYHSSGLTTEMISVPSTRQPEGAAALAHEQAEQPEAYAAPEVANENAAERELSPLPIAISVLPPAPSTLPPAPGQLEPALAALLARRVDEDPTAEVLALHALGEPALEALLARFPGPLWFDRKRPHVRVPFGRDIGPVARALEVFGEQALARFAPLLRARDAEARYYATLFACDRVHQALLEPLLERLFDEDAQIRLLVRDVLPHYRRLPGFEPVAERLCAQALAAEAPLRSRLAAIDAISVLRDAASVPTLIELSGHADKQISVPALRALTAITCQDFGKTTKKWRTWYEANAYRHRVEWLIDGLMHSDQNLRASAGLELQKLTQVYYGYVAAASKRERELAQKRYWDWWRTEGRKKF